MNVNRIHKSYICKMCGVTKGVRQCKCQRVFYCSKDCQLVDWKAHKSDCQRPVNTAGPNNANHAIINNNKSPSQLDIEKQHQNMPLYYRYQDGGVSSQGIQNTQLQPPPVSPSYAPTQLSPMASTSTSILYDGMGQQQYAEPQQYKYMPAPNTMFLQQPQISIQNHLMNTNVPFTNSFVSSQPSTSTTMSIFQRDNNHMHSTAIPPNNLYTSPLHSPHHVSAPTQPLSNTFPNYTCPMMRNERKRDGTTFNQFNDSLRAETSHNLSNENFSKSLRLDYRTAEEPQQSNYYSTDDQLFDKNLLQVIDSEIPFNFNFEDQELLQATKENLEQELLLLNQNQNQQQAHQEQPTELTQNKNNSIEVSTAQNQEIQKPLLQSESGEASSNDQIDMALALEQASLDDQSIFK